MLDDQVPPIWLGTTDDEIRSALSEVGMWIIAASTEEHTPITVAIRIAERVARRLCPADRPDLLPQYAGHGRMPRRQRIEEIRRRYNGRNAAALMAEFGCSRASFYRDLGEVARVGRPICTGGI